MPRPATSDHDARRAQLVEVAVRTLEESGPGALQARTLTAEIGTSTQAVYTLFGGMPGLFEAVVAEGFARFARHVAALPESDDPVADFFLKGWAYTEWALAHPQLYRLMFGTTGGDLRDHAGIHMKAAEDLAETPEGQAAGEVLVRAMERVKQAGRIRPVDTVLAAAQFLSATHGYVLLHAADAFGDEEQGLQVMGELATNLMAGLGDSREAVERSLLAAVAAREGLAGMP